MYNLLISGDVSAWDNQSCILEIGRCVREYTDNQITEQYGDFNQEQVDQIRRFPCIFGYESGCSKDPLFGIIRDVTCRQGKVKIEYDIIPLQTFLSHQDLSEMLFELDILDWELNRTHWAIKNVNLPKELHARNIHLPNWVRSESNAIDISKHIFDVSFSFPGEIREYVESVAVEVERILGPHTYFYDNNYKAQLARPSLDTFLQDIYSRRSRLIVVFLCEKYQEKQWCGIEFRSIRPILTQTENSKIMFIRLDDGQVDGVFNIDGYIDGRNHTPQELANFIRERVSLLEH